jgi:hypothetical protein
MRADVLSKSFILTLPVCEQAHAAEPARLTDSAMADDRNWIDVQ